LRLQYGGLPESALGVEPSIERALDAELDRARAAGDDAVLIVTYTALLELYEVLHKRGVTGGFWEQRS
jgi:hypothetical protein